MEQNPTYHIYFCCNNASYARHYVVLMASVLANLAKEARASFHLVYSGLQQSDLDAFSQMKRYRDCDVEFIQIHESDFADWSQTAGIKHLTVGAYYRIKIPEYTPKDISRAVYFDGDIVVDGDISPMWDIDLNGYCAGVVPNGPDNLVKDNESDRYFNSGVILFNLEAIRKTDFTREVDEAYKKSGNGFCDLDQGLLNATWKNRVRFIPFCWNTQTAFLKIKNKFKYKLWRHLKKPVVIHYTNAYKPWSIKCRNPLWRKYYKYLSLTPYRISRIEYLLFSLRHAALQMFNAERNGSVRGVWRVQFLFWFQFNVRLGR
ncbi:MAG: glycosyltransferase family 8 protein [Smithella sp.]